MTNSPKRGLIARISENSDQITRSTRALASQFGMLKGLSHYTAFLLTAIGLIGFQRVTVYAEVQQLKDGILLASAEQAAQVVDSIDTYTPYIGESASSVQAHFKPEDTIAIGIPIDPTTNSDRPIAYTTYIVQNGDSASSIAQKFDLHVATLQEANNLSNEAINSLAPGQELKIASQDTSTSQDWLAALNKKKQQEEQDRQKRLALSRAKVARGVVTRERISDPGEGSGGANFSFPLGGGFKGVSRRLSAGHQGVDYRADIGSPVKAVQDGTVIEITGGWGGGFGKSIVLSHGGGLTTRYAHLSQINVSIGQSVGQGAIIGEVGSTGNSTGPHLHLQAERNGRPFDPGI